eukprot:gene11509-11602_t
MLASVSARVMAARLRELEQASLITRTENPGRVATVSHTLTEKGPALRRVLLAMSHEAEAADHHIAARGPSLPQSTLPDPTSPASDAERAAFYALGLLPQTLAAEAERRRATDPEFDHLTRDWEDRLAEDAAAFDGPMPTDALWKRIETAMTSPTPSRPLPSRALPARPMPLRPTAALSWQPISPGAHLAPLTADQDWITCLLHLAPGAPAPDWLARPGLAIHPIHPETAQGPALLYLSRQPPD